MTVESKGALNVYNLIQEFHVCIFNTGIITYTQKLSATVKSYNKDIVSFCKYECPNLITANITRLGHIHMHSDHLVFADTLVGNLCRKSIP